MLQHMVSSTLSFLTVLHTQSTVMHETEYGTVCLFYYFGSWTILAVRIGVSSVVSYRLLIPADDGERHPSIQRWKHANRAVFFSTFTVLPTVEAQ